MQSTYSLPKRKKGQPYVRPYDELPKQTLHTLNKVNDSVLALVPGVGDMAFTGSYLHQKKYLPAVASAVGGSGMAVGADSLQQGARTAARVKRRGMGRKKQLFGFTRGLATGVKRNRRVIQNTIIPGSAVIGTTLNNAVKKSPLGETKVGKLLMTDISTPLMRRIKPRHLLRKATLGLFSQPTSSVFICDIAYF